MPPTAPKSSNSTPVCPDNHDIEISRFNDVEYSCDSAADNNSNPGSPTSTSSSAAAVAAATAAASRRRPSSLSIKSNGSGTVKLSKGDALRNNSSSQKEPCSLSPAAHNIVCQHFSCQMKPSSKHVPLTTTTASTFHPLNQTPNASETTTATMHSATTGTSAPLTATLPTPFQKQRIDAPIHRVNSSVRIRRKKQLKEAKNDYEAKVEQYFQQLTEGCGQRECTNRFCASGKGGIRNLHPQAALIMAIQLASKSDNRLCSKHKGSSSSCLPDPSSEFISSAAATAHALRRLEDGSFDQDQRPKPFLQSLFSSSTFLSLFGIHKDEDESTRGKERRTSHHHRRSACQKRNTAGHGLRYQPCGGNMLPGFESPAFRGVLGIMRPAASTNIVGHTPAAASTKKDMERDKEVDESFYYQLDSSDSSSTCSITSATSRLTLDSSDDSDTNDESTLFAIRPTAISAAVGVQKVQALLASDGLLRRWCRSVFQNWEGIGNSFLSQPRHLKALRERVELVDQNELSEFFEAILSIPKDKSTKIMNLVAESLETLLDRMSMNADSMTDIVDLEGADADDQVRRTIIEWCRTLLCVAEWIRLKEEQQKKERQQQQQQASRPEPVEDAFPFPEDPFAQNPAKEEPSVDATPMDSESIILTHKLIQVTSKIASRSNCLIRRVLKQMLATIDAQRMSQLVAHMLRYLLDHFHTGPYKHGEQDTMVMTTKCLELLYQANISTPSAPIIPVDEFCSEELCKKLNIKDEYRIWKRVLQHGEGRHSVSAIAAGTNTSRSSTSGSHDSSTTAAVRRYYGLSEQQRRTRLFLTTTTASILLPYPFANEYQFSWFSYPFLLPASVKRKILQMDAMSQMTVEYEDACVNHTLVVHAQRLLSDAPRMVRNLETNLKSATCPYLLLEIRREHFLEDAFHELSRKWADLKKPLKVKFINGGEEGMDQGGVQKEFFGELFEKLAARETGLFEVDRETRLCWIRPSMDPDIRSYELTGVLMGLAVYNGVIMNLQFPRALWKVLVLPSEAVIDDLALRRKELFSLHDLYDGWPTLASGLQQLLDWPEEVEDVFCRNYEISYEIFGQGVVTIPLIKNGSDIPVTNENREAFVRDYCTYFIYQAQRDQILAIRRGMWSVIGGHGMELCTADVLEVVACGQREGPGSMDLDLTELEQVAEYDDGYHADHPLIRQFWFIVHNNMTPSQRKKLLLFVTASDRVPVGGLKELTFVIQRNGPDSDRLPTALTCFSRLLLPEYSSADKLRERLITAIENAKGFGLV